MEGPGDSRDVCAAHAPQKRGGGSEGRSPRTWRLTVRRLRSARSAERLRGPGRQACGLPGLETAFQVGGTAQPDTAKARRGKRGGVTLRAHHDDPRVGAGQGRNPGLAAWVKPPLEHIAAYDDRPGDLALNDPLFERPDIHQHGTVGEGREGGLWPQPHHGTP